MPASFSFGNIQFDVSMGEVAARAPRDAESPFLILVSGDFSGRANRGVNEPVGGRHPISVDCDNFDSVMARLGAELHLPAARTGCPAQVLRFETLEDFHPDNLVKQVGLLAALVQARRHLQSPATAAEGVAESHRLLASAPATPAAEPLPEATSTPGESTEETLARLMGGSPPPSPPQPKPKAMGVDVGALIKNLVSPTLVPGATPEQTAALSAVEAELSAQLRAILHHPDFQALEAAWRGLDRLVREFGGEEIFKLSLLDVSKGELAADLKSAENMAQSGLFKSLRDQPWALIVGAYSFGVAVEELEMLGRVAKVSARLGAPFVAGGSSHFVGCDSQPLNPNTDQWARPMPAESREVWSALRTLPEATYLGLVLSRYLSRQPYGKGSDVMETFPFEELSGAAPHESYLWGNGAFVCGFLLAEAFRAEGWDLSASGAGDMENLPVYKFQEGGEIVVKPYAEVWLSERAGDCVASQGLMPLLSFKGRGAVRLACIQSVALPAQPLALRRS